MCDFLSISLDTVVFGMMTQCATSMQYRHASQKLQPHGNVTQPTNGIIVIKQPHAQAMLRTQSLVSMFIRISAGSADECMYSKNKFVMVCCGPPQGRRTQ